ncbi:phosphoribosyl-ATP pyrophosphohydrolase [Sediminibacillus dalangtanensis]|uniref:Phosphoribosyl-ATP pyrophosphohydrolase n=1 Tax=Sediminibacillus dalangtanensis TaxID=2729421 RepID=A0ABX7VQ71_9BACI|nr:nucleoside triphosphate pyrophosphohydrolase [Sediminibacillus dalangtanensis]QTM99051.1 phosphoribosyl-ATP pyrophosphohydrolase [Sediminibacillus dalangtanensis]
MPTYHKLVRDYIPQIIEQNGKNSLTSILSDQEYIAALKQKVNEEAEELVTAETKQDIIEEAADMLELLHAIAEVNGTSIEEIEKERKKKKAERGGFRERVFLLGVDD